MSDTPITDSLSLANLDDVETCKELERVARQMNSALRCVWCHVVLSDRDAYDKSEAALAAWRAFEEKYK